MIFNIFKVLRHCFRNIHSIHNHLSVAMKRRWNIISLPITLQEANTMARENGLLPTSKTCPIHRVEMKFYGDGPHGRFRCSRKRCSKSFSGAIGTFFEGARLKTHNVLGLMYCFTRDWSYEDARNEICDVLANKDVRTELSQATIATWYGYCREMVVDHFINIQQNLPPIGGPGVVVQMDESLFGHRKYNRGRVLEGHLIVGMIDASSEEVRIVVVDSCDATTLLEEIAKNVLPGSEIQTDSWRAYDGLSSLPGRNYIHKKVNQGDPEDRFVAVDGTNTIKIESTWRPCRQFFRGCSRFGDSNFAERFVEYLWRRYCRKNSIDFFESLLQAVREAYIV